MPVAYKIADTIVSASIEPEAFGRVSVEAQSMQKPIVASNLGGSKETIMNKKTGLLSYGSTNPDSFPWAPGREPNQTHTGTEGDPDNWAGRCCGPLPAQIGHDRCEQTVPAGTVCGRYL